ncbi:MAG: PAS domain S-box protein, partial [Anaerolineaceae bacterium]
MTNETILVVEDNSIIAAHLQRVLQGFGYNVPRTVTTGEAAVQAANEIKPDLALVDIQLAGKMDGIEASRIMQSNQDMPIVFLTAYAEDERLEQAKLTQPYGYLVKPVQERELYATLEMAFCKHRLTRTLQASEERYRKLIEQIRAVTYLDRLDKYSSSFYMSPQIEQLVGYPPEEWLNDKELWIKLLHPEDRDFVVAENERTNKTGENFNIEYRMVAKDGHIVWVHDEAVLTYDGSGKPYAWHGIMYDITAKKQSEEALRESESRFRLLFNNTIDAILVCPITTEGEIGKFIEVNDVACTMLGYQREELLKLSYTDLIWNKDKDRISDTIRSLEKTKHLLFETILLAKDGSMIPVECNSDVFQYKEQTLTLSIVRDISERKKSEEIIRERENLILAISESSPDLIYVYDFELKKIIFTN